MKTNRQIERIIVGQQTSDGAGARAYEACPRQATSIIRRAVGPRAALHLPVARRRHDFLDVIRSHATRG